MSECRIFNEHSNHNFDWDLSQVCPECGIKEVDFYEKEIKILRELIVEMRPYLIQCSNDYDFTEFMSTAEIMSIRDLIKNTENIKGARSNRCIK